MDITQLAPLVRGSETTRFGDKAYDKTEHKRHWEESGGRYRVNKNAKRVERREVGAQELRVGIEGLVAGHGGCLTAGRNDRTLDVRPTPVAGCVAGGEGANVADGACDRG